MSVPPSRFEGTPGQPGQPSAPAIKDDVNPGTELGAPTHTVFAAADRPGGKLVEKPHPMTPLVRAWVLVLAAIWTLGREMLSGNGVRLPPLSWVTIAGAILVVVLIGFAYLDWRATSFIVDQDEVRIETGVFTKTSQRIRFDRIQSVDITEPFAARLLGLAEISIDVGAEGGHKLRYLSRTRSAAVRDYLLARAHGVRPAEVTQHVRTGVLDDRGSSDEVLVTVPPQRLLLGALLSHEMVLFTVPLVIAISLLLTVDARGAAIVAQNPWLLLGLLLPALGGLWSFVVRRVIGQWNYAFLRSGHGLKVTRGLTSLTSQSVPRHRIQSLRIAQPLWWRGLGLYRLDMAVLGNHGLAHDEDQSGTTSILLPIGTRAEAELVLHTIWPGLRLDTIEVRRSPDRARWLQPLSHSWTGWGFDDSVLLTRAGWLTRVQMVVPHARVQSLAVEQDPLRRRLGLATVTVHTTHLLAATAARNIAPEIARTLLFDEASRARTARLAGLFAEPPH